MFAGLLLSTPRSVVGKNALDVQAKSDMFSTGQLPTTMLFQLIITLRDSEERENIRRAAEVLVTNKFTTCIDTLLFSDPHTLTRYSILVF